MRKPALLLMFAGAAMGVWLWSHYSAQRIEMARPATGPVFTVEDGKPRVDCRCEFLLAEVETPQDELMAWLRFEYLRTRRGVEHGSVLLTAEAGDRNSFSYRLRVVLDRNLLQSIPMLSGWKAAGLIEGYRLLAATEQGLAAMRSQAEVFEWAYNLPVRQRMENLPAGDVGPVLARYIEFKSRVDPRVRRGEGFFPQSLDRLAAIEMAGDILRVARFYDLPLDYFLGIAAMENNYMDVYGDLAHAVWKRRAAAGDIVLERRNGRVRVWNYSTGVWQITRETLRFSHHLFLRDAARDYARLPEHLRPPAELDLNPRNRRVLTTYAGLLFRHLLDYFGGDVEKAAGAYNGGKIRPNLDYARGVKNVASHARKVVEQTAMAPRGAAGLELLRPASP